MPACNLFFEVDDPDERGGLTVKLLRRHEGEHGSHVACECGGTDISCEASAEWPCLYHGVLETHFERLDGRERDHIILRFPSSTGRVTRAFLVCGYEASAFRACGERREEHEERKEHGQHHGSGRRH